jgi:hypothetical protein
MKAIKYFGILCLCLIALQSVAQTPPSKKEQKEARRIAFLTQKLELTPKEAEVFWPVYREYKKAQVTLRKTSKPSRKGNVSEMTDLELEKLLDDMIVYKQEELDLKKKYHLQFKGILPIKKVAKLYHAEEQFNKQKRTPPHAPPGQKQRPGGPPPRQ